MEFENLGKGLKASGGGDDLLTVYLRYFMYSQQVLWYSALHQYYLHS